MVQGRRIDVSGTVQGVGYRPWVYRLAQDEGVYGQVWNDGQGVRIHAFGSAGALDRFERRLLVSGPPAARVAGVISQPIPVEPAHGFDIVASAPAAERRVSIPADLATCTTCEREIRDPANRRFRYAFTNCTDCGPRFTITADVPYDRVATTMAKFVMCAACQQEYDARRDRRFHAEPNACPVCGPRLEIVDSDGRRLAVPDPLRHAVEALAAGEIVALKGIGGFHLACDATSDAAVRRLRALKQRDEKPFAVMVRSLAEAAALASLSTEETALLTGIERPIVLLRRRDPSSLAATVAPGTPLVGLMLPYSPLHRLLMDDVGRPLVMTSGNVSDEPIAVTNDEAARRLGPIADVLLVHDRDIITRCDDSVARVIGGAPVVLRRSRGYVPRAIELGRDVRRPVLACGGLLKNTFCIAARAEAFFGPHIGDLDRFSVFQSYQQSIDRMERFLDVSPEVIAYDLHPGYHSTSYALARAVGPKVGVQHHHAHVASLMAEHRLAGPMLGVAYDGTGYGTDGSAWGGEILRADYTGFSRLATFRPLSLAGGDAAIREPWRLAVALLLDACGDDGAFRRLPPADTVSPREQRIVRRMLQEGLHVATAHGVGRYFDAVGALLLGRARITYEGQAASEVSAIADPAEGDAYPFDLHAAGGLIEIDLRRGVRALVDGLLAGQSPARLSARFHCTIAAATAAAVEEILRRDGRLPIGLTGGCFQNERLVTEIMARLGAHDVYTHRVVPPGDGGLALGQAVIADAIVRSGRHEP